MQCENLLTADANPFAERQFIPPQRTNAFKELISGLNKLSVQIGGSSAALLNIRNWPLNDRFAIYPANIYRKGDTANFLKLVNLFLDWLPNGRQSMERILDALEATENTLDGCVFHRKLLNLATRALEKMQLCAQTMQPLNEADNILLDRLRNFFPRWLLHLMNSVLFVMDNLFTPQQILQQSAVDLKLLLRQANSCLNTLHCFPALLEQSRDLILLGVVSQLDLLFDFTVKTVYFVACYGTILGDRASDSLLSQLVMLVVRTFASYRNYEDICESGTDFARTVHNGLRRHLGGQVVAIQGGERFFSFIQTLQTSLTNRRSFQNRRLEHQFSRVDSPRDENIRAQQQPNGPLTARECSALIRFRDSRGLPLRLPAGVHNTYPQNQNLEWHLFLQNPYGVHLMIDLYTYV